MNEHTMIFVSRPNVIVIVFSPMSLHIGRSTVICIDVRLAAHSYYLFLHERRRMVAMIGIVCFGVAPYCTGWDPGYADEEDARYDLNEVLTLSFLKNEISKSRDAK
jgi:hypothetical protein